MTLSKPSPSPTYAQTALESPFATIRAITPMYFPIPHSHGDVPLWHAEMNIYSSRTCVRRTAPSAAKPGVRSFRRRTRRIPV